MDKKVDAQAIIDDVLKEFSSEFLIEDAPTKRSKPITFWVPLEAWQRYKILQGVSQEKFSAALKEVVKISINRVFEEYENGHGSKAS